MSIKQRIMNIRQEIEAIYNMNELDGCGLDLFVDVDDLEKKVDNILRKLIRSEQDEIR